MYHIYIYIFPDYICHTFPYIPHISQYIHIYPHISPYIYGSRSKGDCSLQRPPVLQHQTPRFVSEFAKFFLEENDLAKFYFDEVFHDTIFIGEARTFTIVAKAVAKEKVPVETHSPRTFAASQSREHGNNSVVSWWNYPSVALYLPLAVSDITHTAAVCMQFETKVWARLSSIKVDSHNPAKEKDGVAKASQK